MVNPKEIAKTPMQPKKKTTMFFDTFLNDEKGTELIINIERLTTTKQSKMS